jgi:hypothetical protein
MVTYEHDLVRIKCKLPMEYGISAATSHGEFSSMVQRPTKRFSSAGQRCIHLLHLTCRTIEYLFQLETRLGADQHTHHGAAYCFCDDDVTRDSQIVKPGVFVLWNEGRTEDPNGSLVLVALGKQTAVHSNGHI